MSSSQIWVTLGGIAAIIAINWYFLGQDRRRKRGGRS